jgi:3-deoxy-D-arabino-heptulosonate 7-phosphate (DAHP) synthase class II
MVEGGCLIYSLPVTLIESANYFSLDEQDAYRTAFEADMINLLVGPLAEAKHVALRDNECFSKNLINVNALHNYGGKSDLEKVYDYLDNFIADNSLHDAKIAELFNNAFQFIDSPVHWKAIERLAGYILDNTKNTISCEEAIAVLDKSTIL